MRANKAAIGKRRESGPHAEPAIGQRGSLGPPAGDAASIGRAGLAFRAYAQMTGAPEHHWTHPEQRDAARSSNVGDLGSATIRVRRSLDCRLDLLRRGRLLRDLLRLVGATSLVHW